MSIVPSGTYIISCIDDFINSFTPEVSAELKTAFSVQAHMNPLREKAMQNLTRLSDACGIELFYALLSRVFVRAGNRTSIGDLSPTPSPATPSLISELLSAASAYRKLVAGASVSIGQRVAQFCLGGTVVVTTGWSSTVQSAVEVAAAAGRRVRVRLLALTPQDTETRLAAGAYAQHAEVTVTPLFAAAAALSGADFVLLGGEAFTRNGAVVVRQGAGLVARLALESDLPVYVAAASFKYFNVFMLGAKDLSAALEARQLGDNIYDEISAEFGSSVEPVPRFEILQPRSVSLLLTDIGVMPPGSAAEEVARSL